MALAASAGGGRPRTWPTCRRCWATSSWRAAAAPPRGDAYRAGARRRARLPSGPGRPRARGRGARPPRVGRRAACVGLSERLPLPGYSRGARRDRAGAGRARRGHGRPRARARAAAALVAAGTRPTWSSCCSRPTTAIRARGPARPRRYWAAAPSVRSADALGWALTRAGRPRGACGWRAARAAARLARPGLPLPRRHGGRGRAAGRSARRELRRRARTQAGVLPVHALHARGGAEEALR